MLYINNLLVTTKLYIHANVWWNNFYVACLTPCTVPPCYLKLRKKDISVRRFEINWLNQRLNICDFHVVDFPNIEVHLYYIITCIRIFTWNSFFFMCVKKRYAKKCPNYITCIHCQIFCLSLEIYLFLYYLGHKLHTDHLVHLETLKAVLL